MKILHPCHTALNAASGSLVQQAQDIRVGTAGFDHLDLIASLARGGVPDPLKAVARSQRSQPELRHPGIAAMTHRVERGRGAIPIRHLCIRVQTEVHRTHRITAECIAKYVYPKRKSRCCRVQAPVASA